MAYKLLILLLELLRVTWYDDCLGLEVVVFR